MLAHLILENVPHSSFFLASGRDRPDCFRFEAVPGKDHLVRRIIPVEALTKEAPEMLSLYGYPDTQVFIEFHAEERDAAGAASGLVLEKSEELLKANKALATLQSDYKQALRVIDDLRARPPEQIGQRITDDQIDRLNLLDLITEQLKPIAGEMETQLDVVMRLAHGQKAPEVPTPTVEVTTTATTFDEATRRAELQAMKPAAFKKVLKGVPDAETLTEKADQIEAILMHEAAA